MFPIEKNIPITSLRSNRIGRAYKYPFKNMDIGDSFFVPFSCNTNKTLAHLQNSLGRCAIVFGKKNNGEKFVTTQMKNDNGVRIWRVK